MTRAAPFTQASAERAIKAAKKVGLQVTGLTVSADGSIKIHTSERGELAPHPRMAGATKLRDAREKFGAR